MATTLTYTVSDFQPFTKIISSDVNSRFSDIRSRLNWAGGTSATTGLADDNLQSNTASGGGLTRATKLKLGTADHVVINDGTGAMSSEAQLSTTRGGIGFSPTLTGNAGKAVVVNDAGTALSLGSPVQSTITLQPASDVSSFTAGEAITANDAVCFDLGKDASNNDIYRVFRCDSDLPARKSNFAGFATDAATVVAHTLTWVDSAALVASNVITWSINGRLYSQAFTTDNDTTLAAIATKIGNDQDVQSASAVDAGSNDRQINITGKGGLRINITGAVVTGGASQATVTITTTQAPSGTAVNVRCFGILSGFTSLTVGNNYYVSSTTGAITSTPTDANPVFVGQAVSSTQLFINKNVGIFQFTTPQIFVRSHGSSTAGTSDGAIGGGGTTTVEHFNFTSWLSGTASANSRSVGGIGDCKLDTVHLYVDGFNTTPTTSLLTESYNKTSWSTLSNRSSARRAFGAAQFGSVFYAAKGLDSGSSVVNALDSFNGSSWTNGVATVGTGVYSPGCFVQNGVARWVGGVNGAGTAQTVHDTYNGTSVSTDTAYPAALAVQMSSGSPSSNGITGAHQSNATTSYQWNGSWSASITMTYSSNPGAATGSFIGPCSGYSSGTGQAYTNGGQNSTPTIIASTAAFGGSSWANSTSSSSGRAAPTAGVF